jgi:hypothetical protein
MTRRLLLQWNWLVVTAVAGATALCGAPVRADDSAGENQAVERIPVYQRQRVVRDPFGQHSARDAAHRPGYFAPPYGPLPRGAGPRQAPSQTSGGAWFQRPYPYHLDYYRMRYGGTYEPYYSGGLYGVPQVIVPPVYGYGGFGYGQPYGFGPAVAHPAGDSPTD